MDDGFFGRRGTITATCNWDKEVYIEGSCESKCIKIVFQIVFLWHLLFFFFQFTIHNYKISPP